MKVPAFCSTQTRRRAGFTILELLATSCLFILIVGFAWEVVSLTGSTTDHQMRRMQVTSSVRVALDTLGQDIYTFVRQNGGTLLFKPGESAYGDALKFLCLSRPEPGHTRSRMTLVSYELGPLADPQSRNSSLPVLFRADAPVSWPADDDKAPADYDFANVLRRPSTGRQPVAEGVICLEVIWLSRDGVVSRHPRGATVDSEGFHRVDLAKTIGFIVTVAAIDRKSQSAVVSPEAFEQARSVLFALSEDDIVEGANPYDKWSSQVGAIIDPVIRQNVFLTQRTYYLPR